jgi:hypothetical protein
MSKRLLFDFKPSSPGPLKSDSDSVMRAVMQEAVKTVPQFKRLRVKSAFERAFEELGSRISDIDEPGNGPYNSTSAREKD